MKFAFSFIILASLFVWIANPFEPGWRWIFFWPASNLYVASVFYFLNSPICFGKQPNGLLRRLNLLFFLPYVVALWWVWYLFAKSSRENAYDQVTRDLWVGRRLDNAEANQTDFDNIVDLTAEFSEPEAFRRRNFLPLYMLDGAIPDLNDLKAFAEGISQLSGKTYVHCAQGHGRTGLVAVAILLEKSLLENNNELNVDSALDLLKSCRPGIHCSKRQVNFLREYEKQHHSAR